MSGRRSITCLASLMVAMVLMMNGTEAQDTPSCASQLIPCAQFLNATKPPSSCCDPLRKTVETQLTCLCNLFYTPGLLQSFNVNITQALGLAGKCGIPGGLSSCKQGMLPLCLWWKFYLLVSSLCNCLYQILFLVICGKKLNQFSRSKVKRGKKKLRN